MGSIAVMADVGGADFHVGDEAMLVANLALLEGSTDVTVLGRDAPADELESAVTGADGVLLSGGGNLSSTWPGLVDQRIRLLELAARHGVPVAAGGQTIGPRLSDGDRARLGSALATVAVLGVREEPSATLALALGVDPGRLERQVDDAFELPGTPPSDPALRALADRGFIGVTLDDSYAAGEVRPGLQAIAAQIAVVAGALDLPVVTVPHVGRLGTREGGDAAAGRALASLLALAGAACVQLPVPDVATAVWWHQRARLTVSTRYHPLVFGSAADVPCLGIHRDAYTVVKLQGALAHVGAERWTLEAEEAEGGRLLPALRALLGEHPAGRDARAVRRTAIAVAERRRRVRLLAAFGLEGRDPPR